MNQTQEPTPGSSTAGPDDPAQDTRDPHPGPPRGPRVSRDQILDVERLRRSSSDRYVAGVSGGLGRHLDIDPLIVRVIFVVTSIFGVGILLYGALWLLLPDDSDRAPLDTAPETRRVLVLVVCGLAALMLFGAVFGDAWSVFPVALLALAGVAVYAALRSKEPRATRPVPYGEEEPTRAYELDTEGGGPAGPGDTTAWSYAPPPPRRPRRTGPILFWPTLAVLAIALGCLAIYDLDHAVAEGAYAALSVGIVGLALVIGAFVGRAGGLILLGLLALPPLLVTSTFGNDFTRSSGQVTERPTQAAQVRSSYDVHSGQLRLDLTGLSEGELAQLDGHRIDIDMSAGEVVVTLPEGVAPDIDAELRMAGEVRVLGRVSSGLNPRLDDITSPARAGEPTISLDIEGAVGRVEILQEGVAR